MMIQISKDPALRAAVFFTLAVHLLLLAWIGLQGGAPALPPIRKVAVQTVVLQQKEKIAAAPLQEKKEVKTPPKAIDPPKKPKAEKKTEKKAEKKVVKKTAPSKKQKLLQEAREKLKKIDRDSSVASPAASLQVPGKVELKEQPASSRETLYLEELTARLQLFLRLPEEGAVDVKLTLMRSGKVAKVLVVNALSKANREYVEEALPGLSFPPFGQSFKGAGEYTFSIALTNDK